MSRYSVRETMDARDIAVVIDSHERLNRKFDSGEIGHELMDIALRFLTSYQGNFAWMHQMKARHAQYGKLFTSQAAGVLNTMVHEIEHELQDAVRQHKKFSGQHTKRVITFEQPEPEKIDERRSHDPLLFAADANAWVVYHEKEEAPTPNMYSDQELLEKFGEHSTYTNASWYMSPQQAKEIMQQQGIAVKRQK